MRFDLHTGDALEVLQRLPSQSVQTIVTSPPYWGLRDYGMHGQIGLSESIDCWVERLVDVFREARRVLRDDGTCWVNLGDSYARAGGEGHPGPGALVGNTKNEVQRRCLVPPDGMKHKDLIGQPWLFAFAARADGWYLRSDIIWSKPAPMPESVTDRPVKSHEYLFLLTKYDRYFYDADAVREPYLPQSLSRRTFKDDNTSGRIGEHRPGRSRKSRTDELRTKPPNPLGRNRRSVWTIGMARFRDAHFATFPEKLVEPCVLAGTSEAGCCASCGAPLLRKVERGEPDLDHQRACGGDRNGEYHGKATKDFKSAKAQDASATKARILAGMRERRTVGWAPSCSCDAGVVPCVVLDPFSGSGTTGAVALRLKRSYVGIELNERYQEEIARPRLSRVLSEAETA